MTVGPTARYVVVSGPPGSGKSTLAPSLAAALGLPLIAKDTIKEALLDVLDVPDVETSRQVGGAAVAAMYAVATQIGYGVLESAWHRSRAVADLRRLPAPVVEVFCRCNREVAEARYRARAGSRAAGHFDDRRVPEELWNDEVARPIAGGWPVVEVDTSGPVDVRALAAQLRRSGRPGS